MKPILFGSDMVRAILAGRKTVTRRVVKPQPPENTPRNYLFIPPYRTGDILYVRETWRESMIDCDGGAKYFYYADGFSDASNRPETGRMKWRPSIHMPKEAARLFLRVTAVRVEQLKDITDDAAVAEGFASRDDFIAAFLKMYPECTEENWVWVIGFAVERISKEGQNHMSLPEAPKNGKVDYLEKTKRCKACMYWLPLAPGSGQSARKACHFLINEGRCRRRTETGECMEFRKAERKKRV